MVQEASSLKGRTIVITRPSGQAEEVAESIRQKGGKPYFMPTIEIKVTSDLAPIKKFIEDLEKGKVDYVIFMSVNGVKYLLDAAKDLGQLDNTKRGLEKTTTTAVGPRTALELKTNQINTALVPEKYNSEGIIESLQQRGILGKTIRIPRTTEANPALTRRLKEMGALVQEIYVYESKLPADASVKEKFFMDLAGMKINAIIFGSSLCVTNLFQLLNKQISTKKLRDLLNKTVTVVAIGPMTAETLVKMGVKVDVMPETPSFAEAVTALARYWNTKLFHRGIEEKNS